MANEVTVGSPGILVEAKAPLCLLVDEIQSRAKSGALSGDQLAVAYPAPLSYAELCGEASRVCRVLRDSAVKRGDYVVVWTRCPVNSLIGGLATLIAGAAYIPIDERTPIERVRLVLEDCAARVVLVDSDLAVGLSGRADVVVISMSDARRSEPFDDRAVLFPQTVASDVAYVIYTSGSTGKPKGVEVTHGNLSNFIAARSALYGRGHRVLPIHPPSFDPGQGAIFWALATGGSLVLVSAGELIDPGHLTDVIARHAPTVVSAAPSVYQGILRVADRGQLDTLAFVLVGGEALPRQVAREHYSRAGAARLVNEYGPTEATIASTAYVVPPTPPDPIPIGRPILGVHCYVVDPDGRLCESGEAGELWVGGPGVAKGYLNECRLTQERFARDPFSMDADARVYRTGDQVRWNEDAQLEFLGRLDTQVKLRGNRIELGEIEQVMRRIAGVSEAVVVLREMDATGPALMAYYSTLDGTPVEGIRQHLGVALPAYMTPSHFVVVDSFPLSLSGKIDRKALAAMPLPVHDTPTSNPPQTPTEELIAAIWSDLLRLPQSTIGRDDDFFALGGHSLLLTALHAALSEQNQRGASLGLLYSNTGLAQLASALDGLSPVERAPVVEDFDDEPAQFPLAPIQETFYFLAQIEPESSAYVVGATIRIRGPLDSSRLRDAACAVLEQNEILRSGVSLINGVPRFSVHAIQERDAWFRWTDEREGLCGSVEERIDMFLKSPLSIDGFPLIHFQLLQQREDEHFLTLAARHIIFDGISVKLFFNALLREYSAGPVVSSNGKVRQYRHFVEQSRASLQGAHLRELLDGWRNRLAGMPSPPAAVPYTYARHEQYDVVLRQTPSQLFHRIDESLTARIRAYARGQHVTPYLTMLAALSAVLKRYTGESDLLLGSPVSLRVLGDFGDMIGCMVNTVMLRIHVPNEDCSFAELTRIVKDVAADGIAGAEVPIAWLANELCLPPKGDTRTPLLSLFFNYLDRTESRQQFGELEVEPVSERSPIAKFDLTVYVHDWGGCIDLQLVYDHTLYDGTTLATFADQFERLLGRATSEPDLPLWQYPIQIGASAPVEVEVEAEKADSSWSRIHHAFAHRAIVSPDQVAVTDETCCWTYGELADRAARVTGALRSAGIGGGERVALYATRSASFVPCLIGAFEAGALCTVIDAEQPEGYVNTVLASFDPVVIMDPESIYGNAPAGCVLLQADALTASAFDSSWPDASGDDDPVAYVVYTSGTTGMPKGIVGSHAPVIHFLAWQAATYAFDESDHFSLLSGLSHDPLFRDVFAPLSVGAQLHIPSREVRSDPQRLAGWIDANQITVMHMTPAMEELIAASAPQTMPSLRAVFFGGDRLQFKHVESLRSYAPNARILNGYGLSETPQLMACHEVVERLPVANIPIGKPIPGVSITVENRAGARCAANELGEIVIRSRYLAQGYLRENGVECFADLGSEVPVFRTGDIGRYDCNGLIQFVRRADRQVKVRGYRIELESIERALLELPAITGARVLVTHSDSDPALHAFVVSTALTADSEVALKNALRASLVEVAVPQTIVVLTRFPMTPNGKVDERAMLAQLAVKTAKVAPSSTDVLTHAEERIIALWSQFLERTSIGVHDDFFDLGGSSLLAVKMLSSLSAELDTTLPVELLMRNPTSRRFAEAVEEKVARPEEPLVVKVHESGARPPFWMLHPVGGHVLFIRRFAKLLGTDQPLFGIQAQGLDGIQRPIDDMGEMAELYIQHMKEHQPEGPYYFGGPSFGGRIAYEIAQRLRARGETVAMLAMLDTWAPGFPKRHRFDRWLLEKIPQYLGEWRTKLLRRVFTRVLRLEKFGHAHYKALDEPHSVRAHLGASIRNVIEANERASRNYKTKPYSGKITLLRASILPNWRGVDFSDTTNGWSQFAESVDVRPVNCRHQHILDHPALDEVVEVFRERLQAAQAQHDDASREK